jgi:hypothetical protein
MPSVVSIQITPAQQELLLAAESLGATAPAGARPLAGLPRLSARELDDLIERGLLREAAPRTYYVFRSRAATLEVAMPASLQTQAAATPRSGASIATSLIFWLIIVLLPYLFIALTRRS